MDCQKKRRLYRPAAITARALAIGGLLSIIATADVSAQTRLAEPSANSIRLRELIDTIPARRTDSPAPVVAEPASPESSAESASEVSEEAISLVLRLSEKRVSVYRGDVLAASYPVAIGRPGWETPIGEFEVFHQLVDPGWTNPKTGEVMSPGPNNPLGDRWIAFWTDGTNSIGFHGTPNRESVGRAASHGCIRMYNEDVRELYEIVSVGTPVTVVQ